MDQPSVKFLNQQFTYFIFIGLIIVSSIIISSETKEAEKFSNILEPKHFVNYTTYALRTDIDPHFNFTDFTLRLYRLTNLDWVLLVWIIGYNYGIFFIKMIKVNNSLLN